MCLDAKAGARSATRTGKAERITEAIGAIGRIGRGSLLEVHGLCENLLLWMAWAALVLLLLIWPLKSDGPR